LLQTILFIICRGPSEDRKKPGRDI